jgi:hypothetical protein
MIFWRKIVVFHTKYPKIFRASFRNWKEYDFLLHLIYKELEWELLAERRNRRGLQMLYYNQNNNAVSYLCDLIPQKKDQKNQFVTQ